MPKIKISLKKVKIKSKIKAELKVKEKTTQKKETVSKNNKDLHFHLLRGMKDILPEEQDYWNFINQKAENLARAYGFQRINTPILEETALFIRGVGQETDIVEKQMFSFIDKGKDNICLRPENTASIVRAYIEHGMFNLPQPVKLYYLSPQFRHEKPQAGRLRQFTQFGLETIGEAGPVIDAQIIFFSYIFFQELGLNISIQVNSLGCAECRKKYYKNLNNFYRSKKRFLCPDCQKRLNRNLLRLLDCKNLECQKIAEEAPQIIDHLCEECQDHFVKVLEYLDELEMPYNLNPRIVRGLDYYTKTIFEIWPGDLEEASQNSLGGGGRYDNLIQLLGGEPTPACGVAYGLERIILELKRNKISLLRNKKYDVFLSQIGLGAQKRCLKLFEILRKSGLRVAERLSKEGLGKQLDLANKLGVKLALILGQKELLENSIIIRDMEDGIQENVNLENIVEEVKKRLKLRVKKKKI